MPTQSRPSTDLAAVAADFRVVLGRLVRRLRSENLFPMHQVLVLGRLDREGARSVSELAMAERVRPQSMAQTVGDLEAAGLVERSPDPDDGRRALVRMTAAGAARIQENRRAREGWLVEGLEGLPEEDQETIERAVAILQRLVDAED